jgi:hypothetical protein
MAVEDLHPCTRAILCALSGTVLRSLNGLITGQIIQLEAQVLFLETQLVQYDILALPVQAAADIARAALTEVRNSALLIPIEVIAGCFDLADFNQGLRRSLDFLTAELDSLVGNLTRMLSLRDELAAVIEELNGLIDQFQDILGTIETCGPVSG